MKIDKYHLNLAGEYRVCAELLKRGIFATVTFGNMKGVDIVAVGPNRRAAIVEVKTSQSPRFVTSFYQKYETPDKEHPTFWVLYMIAPRDAAFDERFFVLTHDEMAQAQGERNCPGENLSYEENARRYPRGKGVDNVLLKNVESYEDDWEKIVRWCTTATS